jgi:hypothetical protein
MVYNSTNINKTNNHLSPSLTEQNNHLSPSLTEHKIKTHDIIELPQQSFDFHKKGSNGIILCIYIALMILQIS